MSKTKFDHTVILAEDDSPLREIIEENLKKNKIGVIVARDGEELMEILKTRKKGLLLLDIWMPKINGYEVLEKISGDKNFKDLKVIVITNLGLADEVVKKVKKLGAIECLLKANISIDKLVEKVKKHLK